MSDDDKIISLQTERDHRAEQQETYYIFGSTGDPVIDEQHHAEA